MSEDLWICPGCGAELRVGRKGCPNCSKPPKRKRRKAKVRQERKSWEQDSSYDGLDLPDEDFDYDEFVNREFGNAPHRRVPIQWYWWVVAILLLGGFAWALFAGLSWL
ncbi:hypothetical protein HAHE_35920 [Haloferula helveola]|uniref:Zinc-ribbon domain-containing protein n=1 Tax=Haloferula helveola TaxID=490095 RepID=A0ABM7RDE8_9BACT|nr:hypothetical protein HAHE_35920 [Haloferula helveola]